jgi:hypothetical protein
MANITQDSKIEDLRPYMSTRLCNALLTDIRSEWYKERLKMKEYTVKELIAAGDKVMWLPNFGRACSRELQKLLSTVKE